MDGRRVLFVLKRAGMGGSCASMINLLSLYKERGITFDVFLMEHSGEWTQRVAQCANLLPENTELASAIKEKSKLKGLAQYCCRIKYILSYKVRGQRAEIKRLYQAAAQKLSDRYDHVVAYQESETTEFVSYINAKHKVAWVHTDFERFWQIGAIDDWKSNYAAFQDVVCVTEASVQSVIRNLGISADHARLIKNMLSSKQIRQRALEPVSEEYQRKKPFLFVSVGRLSDEKAFERIPQAACRMAAQGMDFDWYLIGDGASRQKILDEIRKCNVEQHVHLLGAQMNPYRFIAMADGLVITSHYEAQPMVANEALILDKPVISTEFASVREVIRDGENGAIVAQSPEAIADALIRFMCEHQEREKLCSGAKLFQYCNDKELAAIDALLTESELRI